MYEKIADLKIGYNVSLTLRQNRARLNAILLFSQNYFMLLFSDCKKPVKSPIEIIHCHCVSAKHRTHLIEIHVYTFHDDIPFHITGPLLGESTGDRWIPLTKGQ